LTHPTKITFGEMRASGVRDVLIYCADYECLNWIRVNTDKWSADVRLSDLENQFTCTVCGRKGAEVRPDFDWNTQLRSKTMREAFKRFVEGKPSGTAFVIGGRRATETRRGINK
jgi:hypothetical protein